MGVEPVILCGQSTPVLTVSNNNVVVIEFLSDSTVNDKGFQLEYRARSSNTGKLESTT